MSARSWPNAGPVRELYAAADEAAKAERLRVLSETAAELRAADLQREQLATVVENLVERAVGALLQASQSARDLRRFRQADALAELAEAAEQARELE